MREVHLKSFEELEAFLRQYANWYGDPVPHDMVGVLRLWLALLENLKESGVEDVFSDYAEFLTDEQIRLLNQLVTIAKESRKRESDGKKRLTRR